MKIFLACSYSSKVDYSTGEVEKGFADFIKFVLRGLRDDGYEVFNAPEADWYRINDANPAEAYKLDTTEIEDSDIFVALLSSEISAGIQTEIGYAVAKNKPVVILQPSLDKGAWFNKAMNASGVVKIIQLEDFSPEQITESLQLTVDDDK